MSYNHDRPLEDFEDQIDIITNACFNLIGVSQMYFEDVFIFNTKAEALMAYKTLETGEIGSEKIGAVGWWYSKREFKKLAEEYKKDWKGCEVKTYWINQPQRAKG